MELAYDLERSLEAIRRSQRRWCLLRWVYVAVFVFSAGMAILCYGEVRGLLNWLNRPAILSAIADDVRIAIYSSFAMTAFFVSGILALVLSAIVATMIIFRWREWDKRDAIILMLAEEVRKLGQTH